MSKSKIQLSDHFTYGRLLRFTLPSILMMIFSSVYGTVDGFFISNFAGKTAFAALNLIFPYLQILSGFGAMLGVGGSALVAKTLGEGNIKHAQRYFTMMFWLTLGTSIFFTVFGIAILRPVAYLFGATESMIGDCVTYGTIYLLFTAVMHMQYTFQSYLIVAEKPKFALAVVLAAGCTNMVLDYVSMAVLNMGIAGASIATAISQLTSFVILLVMCSTHADAITIHPRNYRPTKQMYAKILNNGLPSLGRQGIMSVSTSLLNNAAAVYGDPAIAAFAIVSRCLNFVNSTVVGFGQGFQPVCGFNYGARKYDRMHRAFSFSVKVTTIVLLVLGAAGFAFAEPVVTLFRRSDPEVIRIGTETFRIQILTVWAWGFITLSNMYTQAIGYGIRSTILAAARQGLFLIPTLLVLPNVWGLRGLEVCQPLADVLTLALAVWMMTKVIRTQKAQMAQETA